jgi:hypothetical protein
MLFQEKKCCFIHLRPGVLFRYFSLFLASSRDAKDSE